VRYSFASPYKDRWLIVGLLVILLTTNSFRSAFAISDQSKKAQAAIDLSVYDDELAGGWQDWSWDTNRNFNNTEPVHSGSASIAVTYAAAYGGLLFHTDTAVPTSGFIAIRFWVHGGSTGGQSVNFHVNESTENYSFTVQADTWLQVTVPLAVIGNPISLSDLFWQDGSNGSQPTYYIDDISLVETPQIYTDALTRGWQDYSWETTRIFDNTEPVHSGSSSIAVTYTAAYGGLLLHKDLALPTSDYNAILFWVNGGNTGGQSVNFHVNDSEESYFFVVQANTWLQVTVPLAVIGNPTTISELFWQSNSGSGQPTFYLDDISLIKTQPGSWTEVTSPVAYPLRSVAMLSDNDGWAVGYQGYYPNGNLQGSVILHQDGDSWNEWGSDSSGPALFSATTVSTSDGWAVGSNSSNGSAIRHWNGSAWNSVSNPGGQILRSVAMVSANDGWAVGGGGNCLQGFHLQGTIMRWDGGSWSAISLTDTVFYSVAMVSPNDGWAVGYYCYAYWLNGVPQWDSDSLILRWNGNSWNQVNSPTFYALTSVAMASATDGWAVGSRGVIQHWNGSEWIWSTSPTSCDLMSVAMVSANDGWAVGGGGAACPSQPSVILHWNGITWSEILSPVSQKLNSVAMISANEGWAVGEAGTILHYTNSNTLNVSKTGSGDGTVTSSPAGIDCGATCSASFGHSAFVTLTAEANPGSTFAGWSGAGCSGTGTCIVTIGVENSVTANFTQNEYTLTITSAQGAVAREPDQATYHEGDVVRLTATPNASWSFANWTGGLTGSNNPDSVTIHGNTAITANYIQNGYALTITSAHGTVARNPDQASYHEGDVVQLTVTPTAGWSFSNWTGDLTGSANPSYVTIRGKTMVTANYVQLCYVLTRTHTGSGSDPVATLANSDGCSDGQYHAGESISLSASPAVDWIVGSWNGTSNDASTSITNSLTMPSSDRTVTANYINSYKIHLPLVIR
jgi:hypothetical protein